MENLKFRAWDKETNLMNEVTVIDFESEEVYYHHWRYGHSKAINLKDVELLQSTGLKDRNGVEIYEGDIVEELYNSSPFRNITLRSIEMHRGAWVARDVKKPVLGDIAITQSILRGAKVIGNLYENEDLLK